MNNALVKSFTFNNYQLTAIMKDGEPWFVAKDVCDILGYQNTSKAISDNCKDKGITDGYTLTAGGKQLVKIINEGNLYRLVMRSKLPAAEPFEDWVVNEVLPAIRRDGGYMIARPDETPEELALRAMQVMQSTIERQKAELAITKPKAIALDILAEKKNSYCITDAAKLLQLKPSELFEYLQSHGWIYRRHAGQELIGYQKHLINGDLEHKITTVTTNRGERDRYQVRVCQSGLVKLAKLLSPVSE